MPELDFNTFIDNEGYDVNLLLQGAINNDLEAKDFLEYLVHKTNTSSVPIPFQIVTEAYKIKETTLIHASFLTSNDIEFITNSLHEKVNVIYASIKDHKVLFVNPYNANYFIYDTFSSLSIEDVILSLTKEPSTSFKDIESYTEVTETLRLT